MFALSQASTSNWLKCSLYVACVLIVLLLCGLKDSLKVLAHQSKVLLLLKYFCKLCCFCTVGIGGGIFQHTPSLFFQKHFERQTKFVCLWEAVHFDVHMQHVSIITCLVCKALPQKQKVPGIDVMSILNKNVRLFRSAFACL